MKRREFIIALGGSVLWPLGALGQQTASRVVGVLGFSSAGSLRTIFVPAQRRLVEMVFIEGRNLALEFRGADNQEDRLAALAADLVERRVEAIVALGGPPIAAAKAATTSIPVIFFTGYDPVASGFVASLNQPGGNLTGISVLNADVVAKRLEVLRELIPTAKPIGFLYSPSNLVPVYDRFLKDLETAAEVLGVKLLPVEARRPDDFEGAFATIANARSDALLLSPDILILRNREVILELTARYKIPAGSAGGRAGA